MTLKYVSLQIDVDEETLNDNYIKVKPLVSDYLQPKTHSFHVQVDHNTMIFNSVLSFICLFVITLKMLGF